MSSDVEKQIFQLVARKAGTTPDQIGPHMRLLHDLGIDGDDADELLREVSECCQINLASFDFARFFRSEPSLLSLLWFLPPQKKNRVEDKEPLRVSDLVRAAEIGKLPPTD